MRKAFIVLTISFALCLCLSQCFAQSSIQNMGKNARVDWTNLYYVAEGKGVISTSEPNRAIARLKAEDYAKMAAIANLYMAIQRTAIDYESSGADYMADTTISQKIQGFVNNVEVIDTREERYEDQTIVIAKVKAPMFGNNTPGSVLVGESLDDFPAISEPAYNEPTAEVTPEPKVKVIIKPDAARPKQVASAKPSIADRPYTSLVIDSTSYKLDRCMSPKIRRADGTEVWGTVKADYDYIEDHGIVVYATSLSEALKNPRCGSNPLIIRATGRAGGRFYSDPIISNQDAELLLSENNKSGFLNKFNVIFIKDGKL